MNYPLRGKVSEDGRAERKAWLIAVAVLAVIGCGVWLWLSATNAQAKVERAFLWSVAFSDERITSHVGRVKDVRLEQERSASGRRLQDAHHRRVDGGVVNGTIRFLVFGEEGAGKAEIAYRWNHESGEHAVTRICATTIWSAKQPNKAPEPTPGTVTPRAIDPSSE